MQQGRPPPLEEAVEGEGVTRGAGGGVDEDVGATGGRVGNTEGSGKRLESRRPVSSARISVRASTSVTRG